MGARERTTARLTIGFMVLLGGGCATAGETIQAPPAAPTVEAPPPGPTYAVLVSKVDPEGSSDLRVRRLLVPETVETTKAAMMLLEMAPAMQFGGPPHPCYEILVLVRRGQVEAEAGGLTEALGVGDGVTLRRRTPFLLRGAGDGSSEILLVFVPDGMTVGECEDLANRGGPVDPLPADPARPPLAVARQSEVEPIPIAGGQGQVRMLLDPRRPSGSSLAYLGFLGGSASLTVPEHSHAGAAEMLLLDSGRGELTIAGTVLPVSAGMAIHIPPDTPHSFRASRAIEAVQVFAPPGGEDRYRPQPAGS